MAHQPKLTIFEAALQNNVEEVRRYLITGVNSETTRDPIEKRTPLHWAVCGGNKSIVRLLLKCKPKKINYTDKDGKTAMDLCGNNSESREIRGILRAYQESLDQPVYDTNSCSVKDSCRWRTTRLRTISNVNNPHRRYDEIHLRLIRHSPGKSDSIQWSFDVNEIHNMLSANISEILTNDGNNAYAALTFHISLYDNKHHEITIPVRTSAKNVYTRTDAEYDAGGQNNFLDILRCYSEHGRTVGNRRHIKHGHQPTYLANESHSMQQFINHSEQTLAAYLSSRTAACYFLNALRVYLRSEKLVPLHSKIRIYSITLHIHSTKTPCGPCEFVLVGMMNATAKTCRKFSVICMRERFQTTFLNDREYYEFTFGEAQETSDSSSLNLFTTFTANFADQTHQLDWTYNKTNYTDLAPTLLDTADCQNSHFLFICRFQENIRKTALSNISDCTMFTSASNQNSAIPRKKLKIEAARDNELDNLCGGVENLYRNQYTIPEWTLDHEIPPQIIKDFENGRLNDGSILYINSICYRLTKSQIRMIGKGYIVLLGSPGKTSSGEKIYLTRGVQGG